MPSTERTCGGPAPAGAGPGLSFLLLQKVNVVRHNKRNNLIIIVGVFTIYYVIRLWFQKYTQNTYRIEKGESGRGNGNEFS